MTDERPETCAICGAPVVWCACESDADKRLLEVIAQRDALRERCAELELRLDVYNGNMYDVVVAENERLRARISELTEQANAAYAPYRERVIEARNEVNHLSHKIAMKDAALESYAEFYGRAAGLAGLPDDALTSTTTDEIILTKIAEHDEIAPLRAEVERLRKALKFTLELIDRHGTPTQRAHAISLVEAREALKGGE